MITLHILQLLADNDFGTMQQDLFWEKFPLTVGSNSDGANGVSIMSRGGVITSRSQARQAFDLYCRAKNDLRAADRLERIRHFLLSNNPCELPAVEGKSVKTYKSVRFTVVSNVENLGLDETDRLLFRLSCEVIYIKE